ncbi:MAG: hypothetical protein PVG90_02355 [Bacillota bacterium]
MKSVVLSGALLLLALFAVTGDSMAQPENSPAFQKPATLDVTLEQKRNLRVALFQQMLVKYQEQQVFEQMRQYMISKLDNQEIEPPEVLIGETLDRTRSVYEKIQPLIGNHFKRNYNPESIEAKFNKFAWLKGVAFLILGIRKKHKIAISFFYLPENTDLKQRFFRDVVHYSYPEVLTIPENEAWFAKMDGVMERMGFKYFKIAKYL